MNWDRVIIRDETDRGTLRDVRSGLFHVPKMPLHRPQLIVDLGCHAGYTIMHYAELYPTAYIWGFDLSPENVATARQNIELAGLADRVTIDCAGIGSVAGRASPTPGASNSHMIHMDSMGEVPVITMHEVLALVLDGDPDFVKFDIEGAERGVFKQPGWAERVKHLKAELHWDYTVKEGVQDLERLGFVTVVDGSHPACVEAWR